MLTRTLFWRLMFSSLLVLALGLSLLALAVSQERHVPEHLLIALGISFLIAGLVAAVLCLVFVRRISAPIEEIVASAEAISRGDLERRFRTKPDELGGLGPILNGLGENLKKQIRELSHEDKVLRMLLAEMHDGVIACDREGRLVFANDSTARLLQVDLANAVGRPLAEVIRLMPLVDLVRTTLETGEPSRLEMETQPLSDRHVRAFASALATSVEGAPRVIVVLDDITEDQRYENLRRQFVANVSHELRTPVTIIKGYLETLQDGAMHDSGRGPEFLARIQRNVDQLANLVDDLLQLSRLDAPGGAANVRPIDLVPLVERVVSNFEPVYSKKRQKVSIEREADALPLKADPDLVERAVSNLIDNAIKYTPEEGVIRIRVEAQDRGARIEVQDNGIGIPAADLPRIFERFYRVDKSRSREMGGTGLGLSIVKHIAQIHGGKVEVRSALREGSTFSLWLPL